MTFSATNEGVNEFKKRKRGQRVEKCLGIKEVEYKLTRWNASCYSERRATYISLGLD